MSGWGQGKRGAYEEFGFGRVEFEGPIRSHGEGWKAGGYRYLEFEKPRLEV